MAYATISKPGLHFNTKLYTGTGSSLSVTGVGFQPDWTWIKSRVATHNHFAHDAVRGVTKSLFPNLTSTEDINAQYLTAFGTDGFTVGTNGSINSNGDNYASWNWKAGGTTSSNTDGDINSTVSVNTTAGFSIVSYTGNGSNNQTVGHGLGVKPAVMIFKNRDDTNNWVMYHHKLNNGTNPEVKYLELNGTNAQLDDASIFNDTAPTSTLFTIGSASDTGGGSGGNNEKIIAYCFAEKTGYSKFGSYIGNNSTDGTFVYTGFKPAWILIKNTTTGGTHWRLADTKRTPFNTTQNLLFPSSNAAENTTATGTGNDFQIFSNGFKLTTTNNIYANESGSTFIYMAFAENPIVANVGANGIPVTAR